MSLPVHFWLFSTHKNVMHWGNQKEKGHLGRQGLTTFFGSFSGYVQILNLCLVWFNLIMKSVTQSPEQCSIYCSIADVLLNQFNQFNYLLQYPQFPQLFLNQQDRIDQPLPKCTSTPSEALKWLNHSGVQIPFLSLVYRLHWACLCWNHW